MSQEWFPLGPLDDFTEGEPAARIVNQRPVAVFRLMDEIFAMHDLCPHGQALLSEGYVENGCVECPLHQGLIDIRTGAPCSAPITEPVRTYPVRIVDGQVQIHVD